jgi:DNA polymerase-3 subunit beta
MHIQVNRDVLFKAFSHSQGVIERKTTLLILGHTLLQAKDGTITLISTDMDISLSETIGGDIVQEGCVCIPTILTYEILRKLKSGAVVNVMFSDSLTQVVLSSGRSKFEIPCISSEEFPRILQDDSSFTSSFMLPAQTLKNMIETVRFATSNDEMRYALNGINFSYDTSVNKLRAVATDRHRLASIEIEGPDGVAAMPSIIIGKKTIGEFSKLLDEAIEPVSLSVSDTRVGLSAKFEKSSVTISSRLIDGSFPEYSMVLNIKHDKKIIAVAKSFAELIDRVGTVISEKSRVIKVSVNKNLLHCSAVGNAAGSAAEDIDVDYDGDCEMNLSFDAKYLLDVAQHISSNEMEISLTSPDTAVSIRPVGVEGVYFAIMPLASQ